MELLRELKISSGPGFGALWGLAVWDFKVLSLKVFFSGVAVQIFSRAKEVAWCLASLQGAEIEVEVSFTTAMLFWSFGVR